MPKAKGAFAQGRLRLKKVASEGTTLYIGPHFEVQPLPASPLPVPQPPPTLPKRISLCVPLVANNALTVDGQPAQLVKFYLVGGQRIASRAGTFGGRRHLLLVHRSHRTRLTRG